MSARPNRDALAPQQVGGRRRGLAIAVAVHAALIAAIAWGVRWRSSAPEGVSAELWAAVPQTAAPRPVPPPPPPPPPAQAVPPPPPPPREPEIAVEREKPPPKPVEKKPPPPPPSPPPPPPPPPPPKPAPAPPPKPEIKPEAPKPPDDRQQRLEQQQLAKQREENLQRMLAQAGTAAPNAAGQGARSAGPSAGYAGRIRAAIRPNIVLTDTVAGNPTAEVEVRVAPDGTIVGRRIAKSSGSPEWDDAVLRAIDRTERLPRDTDGRVQPTMTLVFQPKE